MRDEVARTAAGQRPVDPAPADRGPAGRRVRPAAVRQGARRVLRAAQGGAAGAGAGRLRRLGRRAAPGRVADPGQHAGGRLRPPARQGQGQPDRRLDPGATWTPTSPGGTCRSTSCSSRATARSAAGRAPGGPRPARTRGPAGGRCSTRPSAACTSERAAATPTGAGRRAPIGAGRARQPGPAGGAGDRGAGARGRGGPAGCRRCGRLSGPRRAAARPRCCGRWQAAGHRRAILVPLLLTAAYHGRVDIPAAVAAARTAGLRMPVRMTDVLGPAAAVTVPLLLAALRRRLADGRPGPGTGTAVAGWTGVVLAAAGTRDAGARGDGRPGGRRARRGAGRALPGRLRLGGAADRRRRGGPAAGRRARGGSRSPRTSWRRAGSTRRRRPSARAAGAVAVPIRWPTRRSSPGWCCDRADAAYRSPREARAARSAGSARYPRPVCRPDSRTPRRTSLPGRRRCGWWYGQAE